MARADVASIRPLPLGSNAARKELSLFFLLPFLVSCFLSPISLLTGAQSTFPSFLPSVSFSPSLPFSVSRLFFACANNYISWSVLLPPPFLLLCVHRRQKKRKAFLSHFSAVFPGKFCPQIILRNPSAPSVRWPYFLLREILSPFSFSGKNSFLSPSSSNSASSFENPGSGRLKDGRTQERAERRRDFLVLLRKE